MTQEDYISRLAERANETFGIYAQYLAMLAGMWAHTFGVSEKPNFVDKRLNSWYRSGVAASKSALNL